MSFEFNGNSWSQHPEYDKGFVAGQQSKQGDIDKLISQINEALDAFEDGEFNYCHKTLMKVLGDK